MSDKIIDRYYRVESYSQAVEALAAQGLAEGEELRSRWHTCVVWVGQITDPPPVYDENGEMIDPGVDRGLHLNISSRDPAIIDALDARFERMEPDTPVCVRA